MTNLVKYDLKDGVATISMDDGKVNALSHDMLDQLNAAFDSAQAEGAVVLLTGRSGMFCGGFHLPTMMQGMKQAGALMQKGFALFMRILTFPTPVVLAVNGHAMAMGALLLMGCDYAVGTSGAFKIGMNEVAIGMTMPQTAVEIAHDRISAPYVRRVINNAEVFSPEDAVRAGFLHETTSAETIMVRAQEVAAGMTKLNMTAFAATKAKTVTTLLAALEKAVLADQSAVIVN